jgi:anti-anti-sigma regulatory factor
VCADTASVPVDAIAHGNHLCGVFAVDAQHEELVIDFVRGGFARGERVAYYADENTPEQVMQMLRDADLPADESMRRGQLVLLSAEETYLTGGTFEPERMISSLHAAIDDALADGYRGFRMTGEMSWASRGVPGAEHLDDYEARVGEVYATRPATGLCQYDRRLFDSARLETMLTLHPHAVRTAVVSDDGMLRITQMSADEAGAARLAIAGEVDTFTCSVFAQALSEAAATGGNLHLDLSRLRFLDLAATRSLEEVAAKLSSGGGELILHDPPWLLKRISSVVQGSLAGA